VVDLKPGLFRVQDTEVADAGALVGRASRVVDARAWKSAWRMGMNPSRIFARPSELIELSSSGRPHPRIQDRVTRRRSGSG